MRHYAKLATLLFLAIIAIAACTSGPDATSGASRRSASAAASGGGNTGTQSGEAADGSSESAGMADRDWRLAEIRSAGKTVTINRTPPASFATVDLSGWFSIRFQDGQVSGVGAPNRYVGPYTLADNQAIAIGPTASTMMASFYELAELKEREYFAYLQNAYRWNLSGGNLELHTRADGTETVLVFSPTT